MTAAASFLEGREAFVAHVGSDALKAACCPLTGPVEVIEKLFLPPLDHEDVDRAMQRPLPQGRKEWRRGYLEARKEYEEAASGGGEA